MRFVTALLIGLIASVAFFALPADAAEGGRWRANARFHSLPFPRGERAAAVWEAGACWSDCGTQTAWGLPACLRVDRQGECLAWADAGDRYCQRQCRTSGGPLLPIDF